MGRHVTGVIVAICTPVILMVTGFTSLASNHEGVPTVSGTPPASGSMDIARVPTWTPTIPAPDTGCVNHAAYVADVTIPDNSVLSPGEVFTKTWRVKNNGSCLWKQDYRLVHEGGQRIGSPASVVISDALGVGGTEEISVPLVAPETPGLYSGVWRIADDEGEPFGDILTAVIVVNGAGGNPSDRVLSAAGSSSQSPQFGFERPSGSGRAAVPTLVELDTDLIDDSVDIDVRVPTPTPTATPAVEEEPPPDPVKAGGRFIKTWVLRNSGIFDWGSGYMWSFVGGDRMGAPDGVEIPPTAAGGRFEVEVPMIAPTESGVYEGIWQMRDPSGKLFGRQGVVSVKVNEIEMNQPVRIGNWEIRVVRVERDTTVYLGDDRFEAEGVFALIRMKVTYLGEGTGWMNVDLDFSAHDEDGYAFNYNEDIGDAARWMIADQAAIDFGFPPGTSDYPALIAFPVPAESKELWLDVSLKEEALNWLRKENPEMRLEDITQQASFYLRATESKSAMTYRGTFVDANPMDE